MKPTLIIGINKEMIINKECPVSYYECPVANMLFNAARQPGCGCTMTTCRDTNTGVFMAGMPVTNTEFNAWKQRSLDMCRDCKLGHTK